MKKLSISKAVHSHVILSTVLISAILIGALTTFDITFLGGLDGLPPEPGVLALFTLGQMVLAAITIFLMVKFNVFSIDNFKTKNLGRGLLRCLVCCSMLQVQSYK